MVLLSMDITDLTFEKVIVALAVFIVVWFVVKNFLEMKNTAKAQFEREQGWDKAAKVIKEKESVWDDAVADIMGERKFIVDRYDTKLESLEDNFDTKIASLEDKVEMYKCDNKAQSQELKSDIIVIIRSIRAILQGLIEQGCDGPVKAANEELQAFLESKV